MTTILIKFYQDGVFQFPVGDVVGSDDLVESVPFWNNVQTFEFTQAVIT